MYKRLAAATLSISILASPMYCQTPEFSRPAEAVDAQANMDTRIQRYLEPVQTIFRIDLRAAYEKARDLLTKDRELPNPHPIILHDPIEELLRDEAPPTLIDAVEAHMNRLAQFRAEEMEKDPYLENILSRYDPAHGIVRAYDFGDIRNIAYTTNARVKDPVTGTGTDALVAYFEFHPSGKENDLQYRVFVPLEQVTKVDGEAPYFEKTYNKVLGVIEVKRKAEPDTAWKQLHNPTLERLKDAPKRKNVRDPRMPDASSRSPRPLPGSMPPGRQ